MDILKVGTVLEPKGNGDQKVIVIKKYRILPFGSYTIKLRKINGHTTITWTEEEVLSMYKPTSFDPTLARLLYIE